MTTNIATLASAVLAAISEGVDPEGNVVELFEALGAAGFTHAEPEGLALDPERSASYGVVVIADPAGEVAFTVCPHTGNVVREGGCDFPAGPAPVATPDPVKYYRILVNRAACPFFRTSRLHNAAAMFDALTHMRFGFSHGEDASQYALSVLSVSASGVGHIVGDAELAVLADSVQDVPG